MLTKLKHKSIIAMKSAWVDKSYLYILLDYALNGDLLGFLKTKRKFQKIQKSNFLLNIETLSMDLSQYFAAQILSSLAYLRSQNVVHRDLKPANIVLNENF